MKEISIQGVGVSLRQRHCHEFLSASPPDIPWLEIISDQYMFTHGLLKEKLLKIRERYPMIMHGVGMNLGSVDPLSIEYLQALVALANQIEPAWISDHLCWTGIHGQNSHDLLPLPYTKLALQHLVSRIQHVQDYLKRPLLIENVSSYLQASNADYTEAEFLNETAKRSGCFILLDVNNIYVSATNHGFSAQDYLDTIDLGRVKQCHLAGFEKLDSLLVDTHGVNVHQPVWELYHQFLERFGAVPTNIEWDSQIPSWDILQHEIEHAQSYYATAEPVKILSADSACRKQQIKVETSRLESYQQQFFDDILSNSTKNAGEKIYQASMTGAHLTALKQLFPCCEKLLGAEYFQQLVWLFLEHYVSNAMGIDSCAEPFIQFIEAQTDLIEQVPYIADMAKLDWAWNRCFHGANNPALKPQELTEANELSTIKGLQLVKSNFPLGQLWEMCQPEYQGTFELDDSYSAVGVALVQRQSRIYIESLDQASWKLITHFANGKAYAQRYRSDEQATLALLIKRGILS